jgi:hypothetical protein
MTGRMKTETTMSSEEKVKAEYPDSQICWTSRGWRIFAGHYPSPGGAVKEIGRTNSAHVPPTEAWDDAAKRLEVPDEQ